MLYPRVMEFKNLNREDILQLIGPKGGTRVQVMRLLKHVYRDQQNTFVGSDLRSKLRAFLTETIQFSELSAEVFSSEDGSSKLKIPIEKKFIESVWMPIKGRSTQCVSSQVGCSLDCAFCLTGQLKLMRNLEPWEIVDQVMLAKRLFPTQAVSNLVFMGMGEPFYNYDHVKKAIEILTDHWGLGIAHRKITVSTSGHIPGILKWAKEGNTSLAVSIITADSDLRTQLMSINKKYPLDQLIEAMKEYISLTHKKIFVEYILMKDLTDSLSAAKKLSDLLKNMDVTVNLIPYNDNPHLPYQRPSHESIFEFRDQLRQQGLFSTIRWSHGGDILGACGQLSAA